MKNKKYNVPKVIVDEKERKLLDTLTKRYQKLITPGPIKKTIHKVSSKTNEIIPTSVKDLGEKVKGKINEQELIQKSLEILGSNFQKVQEFAAKYTVSEALIYQSVNKISKENIIEKLDEICLLRAYDLSKVIDKYQIADISAALVQGAGLGAAGFIGLPFNLVISTFLFFRAVQTIGLFYGYDVKNNPVELEIASEVFVNSMNPSDNETSGLSGTIAKIMLITETTVVKQTAKKGWEAMANKNIATLLITQMRALANKSAQKALEKAGKGGLEKSIFSDVFEQIGKKLSQKALKTSIPHIVGAVIGGTIDTSQMINILKYANIFYCKRFILEKEENINLLLDKRTDIIEGKAIEKLTDNE